MKITPSFLFALAFLCGCGGAAADHKDIPFDLHDAAIAFAFAEDGQGLKSFPVNNETGAVAPAQQTIAGNYSRLKVHGSIPWLYAANAGSSRMEAYSIAGDGTLNPGGSQPVQGVAAGRDIVLTPNGRFLYYAGGNVINQFSLSTAANGLTVLSPATVPFGDTQAGPGAANPGSNFVYFADASKGQIRGFTVGGGGTLTPLAGNPVASVGGATAALVVDDTNQFLFALDNTGNRIVSFALNADGSLTPASSLPVGNAGDQHTDMKTRGNLLLVADGTANLTKVVRFDVNGAMVMLNAGTSSGGGRISLMPIFPFLICLDLQGANLRTHQVIGDGTIQTTPGTAGVPPGVDVDTFAHY